MRKKYLNDRHNLPFLVSWCLFFGPGCAVKCDADTSMHRQHENTAHLLVPGDDKVKRKSVSRYSTWKRRYRWLGRLNPRRPWPWRCWPFYIPSHLHVHRVAFPSTAFLLKTVIRDLCSVTAFAGPLCRIPVLCKCRLFVGCYSLVIWD